MLPVTERITMRAAACGLEVHLRADQGTFLHPPSSPQLGQKRNGRCPMGGKVVGEREGEGGCLHVMYEYVYAPVRYIHDDFPTTLLSSLSLSVSLSFSPSISLSGLYLAGRPATPPPSTRIPAADHARPLFFFFFACLFRLRHLGGGGLD